MSGKSEKVVLQEQGVVDREQQGQVHELPEEARQTEKNEENQMPSTQEQEVIIKKKYGGILPKKKPLISKDHEHAFFDSADWALGKQGGHKPKGPLEALRPKLQPTPHQQVRSRRSAYAPADGEDISHLSTEDHDCIADDDKHEKVVPEDQTCHN
ncbi:hypothetical protein BVRB_6g153580 [Beta vulgaris subsp. vulgaris]|uniref:uncharacterized protein LOC104897880 n=1 Tax=Beta vulgaris subsp. vulgaris TaxID=3555 RepID=UPI00053F4A58|nr:uncharacterized protein LOC104897880 [Beta vulgaris subsp. vulgaris]XP_010683146.1 uncharacterized protein LOC104897880 [Beta vulgaris subsp. vulgaris]KMT07027.1 hypothetical protein BVRB_6g153580 [Beta vulgaris subsp. vulgaris]